MTTSSSPERFPDFLIIGAPKAGTTALHAALVQHPQLRLSTPKEPKYFMCGDAPPPLYVGPGDAHSRREWVWRRDEYTQLFADVPKNCLAGESTPFYLYDVDAQRRIKATIPHVKLIAVLRDPVDRAYSNWMHLWVDGLEPVADFVEACRRERKRIDAGWAPFWRYTGLGKYGEQLSRLYDQFPEDQILVTRYRDLVDNPREALDTVCRFLGVQDGAVESAPSDNTRPFVADSTRTRSFGRAMRIGAWVGAALPPHVWRKASRPILSRLQNRGAAHRPQLSSMQRRQLVDFFREDIELLAKMTGRNFDDWLSDVGRGGYTTRVSERIAS
jgi:hypothetical protein